MTRAYRRSGGLAVLAAAAAIGLAACSGGSSPPQVASLGNSGGHGSGNSASGGHGSGSSAAAGSKSNPTRLVDEWAACMRRHGDPNQVDPTINSDGDIEITMSNVSEAMASQAHGSSGPCGHYLTAASTALRGGKPAPKGPSMAKQLKYAECMRANGVPKYPDPTGATETNLRNIGMSLNSPTFQNANKICAKKAGMPSYYTGAPPPGVVQVRSCNAPAGTQCPNGGPPPGGNRPGPAASGNGGSGANG